MKIDIEGRIAITGRLFEVRDIDPVMLPFVGYIDTGCIYDMVVPLDLANAVLARIESDSQANAVAGTAKIDGTIRKINVRFGGLTAKNVKAFVPNKPSERVLVGIRLMQKIGAFMAIDFHSGSTQGGIITNDRIIPFLIGKVLHYKQVHNKEIVSRSPCEFCGQVGKTDH